MIIRQQPKCFIWSLAQFFNHSPAFYQGHKGQKEGSSPRWKKKRRKWWNKLATVHHQKVQFSQKKNRKNEKQNWTMCCIVHHLLWMCIQLRQFFVFFVSFLLSYSQQSDTSFQEKFHQIGQGIFKTEEWWRTAFCYKLWKSITGWTEQGGLDIICGNNCQALWAKTTWYRNQTTTKSAAWKVSVLRKLWLFAYPVVPVKSLA